MFGPGSMIWSTGCCEFFAASFFTHSKNHTFLIYNDAKVATVFLHSTQDFTGIFLREACGNLAIREVSQFWHPSQFPLYR